MPIDPGVSHPTDQSQQVQEKLIQILQLTLQKNTRNQFTSIARLKEQGTINEEQEQKLQKEIEDTIWSCYKDNCQEIKYLSADVYRKGCIRDVEKITDQAGNTSWKFRTVNLCPDLFFDIQDGKQINYWKTLDTKINELAKTPKSWEDLYKVTVPNQQQQIPIAKECIISSKTVYINSYLCSFNLPLGTPRKPVELEDIVYCNSCINLAHKKSQCITFSERKAQALKYTHTLGIKNRTLWNQTWNQIKAQIQGACYNCGRYGHEGRTCENPPFCKRCKSKSHSSRITLKCPNVRSKLAT